MIERFPLAGIGADAEVLEPVGDDEVSCFDHLVVLPDLVEGLLAELDRRCLAFDYQDRGSGAIVSDDVRTVWNAVQLEPLFDRCEPDGVAKLIGQVVEHVLANPLFRREDEPLLAERVEHLCGGLTRSEFEIAEGQVESRVLDRCHSTGSGRYSASPKASIG